MVDIFCVRRWRHHYCGHRRVDLLLLLRLLLWLLGLVAARRKPGRNRARCALERAGAVGDGVWLREAWRGSRYEYLLLLMLLLWRRVPSCRSIGRCRDVVCTGHSGDVRWSSRLVYDGAVPLLSWGQHRDTTTVSATAPGREEEWVLRRVVWELLALLRRCQ